MKLAVIFVLIIFATAVHAGDTGPGDISQSIRDLVEYVRYFFSTPEAGFNAPAINTELPDGPLVIIERRGFFSLILNEEKNYTVLLPPGYSDVQKKYPVYYLLHGYGGDDRSWATRGNITEIYQKLLSGGMSEMIIVMPDGDDSFWENGCVFLLFSCGNYEDYFFEMVDEIDSSYRTNDRRAIGGLSFGARGAMRLAFLYPDRFLFVGGHSGYYYYLVQEMTDQDWASLKGSGLVIYFDNSKNDVMTDYSKSSSELNSMLSEKGIRHEYVELDFYTVQSHAWPFWKQRIEVALKKGCDVIC